MTLLLENCEDDSTKIPFENAPPDNFVETRFLDNNGAHDTPLAVSLE